MANGLNGGSSSSAQGNLTPSAPGIFNARSCLHLGRELKRPRKQEPQHFFVDGMKQVCTELARTSFGCFSLSVHGGWGIRLASRDDHLSLCLDRDRKVGGTSFASKIQNFRASCVTFACWAQATAFSLLMILETRLSRASVIGLRIWRRVSS